MSTTPKMFNVGSSIYLWGSKHAVDVWILTEKKKSICILLKKNRSCVTQLTFVVYVTGCGKNIKVVTMFG